MNTIVSPEIVFTDTHCHIHESSYADGDGAYERALVAGVHRLICVGTDVQSSREAVAFADSHPQSWAVVGIHPHEAAREGGRIDELQALLAGAAPSSSGGHLPSAKIVGIGEIGLDYYYTHSPREVQIALLEAQMQLALEHDLPISFHVREAFDDFWPILRNFQGVRGVLHSYTDNLSNMERGLSEGLLIGVNGISTFAKDKADLYKAIPLDRIVFETDAPFLTPHPHRGTVNEPALLTHVANFIANLQSINLTELSQATERSATHLFSI